MEKISAAGNLTIEVGSDQWRLIANGNGQEKILVEASPGQPLRYMDIFATKRRLPEEGSLQLDNVQRVVLGWSQEDESWHLGLLLGPDIAVKRGSRWCEIARWPDPDINVFSEVALQAGRSLARTLTRPFNLIEPETREAAAPIPAPPLRDLPLQFDLWTLEKSGTLQFTRAARWARGQVLRIVWYALLIAAYLVLSIVTLQQIIALPKPEFLPYLGLVTAALLFLMIIYTLYQLFTRPNTIVIDTDGVTARHSGSKRWRVNKGDVQAVYVSEVVNKKGNKRIIYHGELSVFLQDGSFQSILEQPHPVEDDEYIKKDAEVAEAIFPLTSHHAHSDLQMAGLYVAEALGVECRYDRRVK